MITLLVNKLMFLGCSNSRRVCYFTLRYVIALLGMLIHLWVCYCMGMFFHGYVIALYPRESFSLCKSISIRQATSIMTVSLGEANYGI